MKAIALFVAAVFFLSAGPVLAQVQVPQDDVVEVIKERTFITIVGGADIKGELKVPSAQYWVGKRQVKFDSQIRVRQNFLPELMRSANAL